MCICWVFLQEKLPEACNSCMTGLRLTLHFSSKNISPPLMKIDGMNVVGQWLGLPGHWTSHQWTPSYGSTLKPCFTSHQLILKTVLFPVSLREQQPPGSNLAWLSSHVSLCCVHVGVGVGVGVGCLSRSMSVRLNMCSELLLNITFLQNNSVVLLDFLP